MAKCSARACRCWPWPSTIDSFQSTSVKMAEARLPTRLLSSRVLSRVLLGFICWTVGVASSRAAEAGQGELQLRNGDHWTGRFAEGSAANEIRWQSEVATAPFDFVP